MTTRASTAADDPFLFELYSAVRAPEFAQMPLPEEQRLELMKMQYTWQTNAYRAAYLRIELRNRYVRRRAYRTHMDLPFG